MHSVVQRKIAQQIVEQGGDYLLAVKENQPALLEHVLQAFEHAEAHAPESMQTFTTEDKGHGRHERRPLHHAIATGGL